MADQRLSTAAAALSLTPGGGDGQPSVERARQWLYQVILPRRVFSDKAGGFRLVEMGEDPAGSELFPVWGTSLADLAAFGIGIGMYFRMLLQLALLMAALAALSAPTIAYFASDDYSGPLLDRKMDVRIWGTAACTRHPAANATGSSADASGSTESGVNDCPLVMKQLYVDMVALVVLCCYCIYAGITQNRTQAYLDALAQTAADYSIVVKDPNANAWDPDEWKDFFQQFGPVKCVTVAVNNHELLSSLAHKRYMEDMLRMESPDPGIVARALKTAVSGIPTEEFPKSRSWTLRVRQALNMHRDLTYWVWALHAQRAKIRRLVQHEAYRVWSVFVMFETEEAQRKCLQETRVGLCATALDCSSGSGNANVPRFRGSNILHVEQAVEPSSVQWKNVGVSWPKRFSQQVLTVSIVGVMMVGVYYMARALKRSSLIGDETVEASVRRSNLYILAYALSITDYIGCKVLAYLNLLEQHHTKEREQLSTLNKLLLFRSFNSAIVMYLLMDFMDILSQQNLLLVQALLIANLVTIPALQLISPYDRFMRWKFGPLAKTQRKLNSYYSGAYWQLAERYTQITKSVGIALFYKPILPTGLAITTVSLLVNYWVDKYCLLRKWHVPPKFDGLLARASRYHLLLMALVSLVMMGHWYDGWPFDAEAEQSIDNAKEDALSFTSHGSWLYWLRLIFPFPRTYSSPQQTRMMKVLTILLIALTGATIVFLILKSIYRAWRRYVVGSRYGLRAAMSDIEASRVKDLVGYVPNYESWWSDFPYLCVALRGFDHRLIDWSGDHSAYCLVNDVLEDRDLAVLIKDRPIEQLFGGCKQYIIGGGSGGGPSTSFDDEDMKDRIRKCESNVV